MDDRVPFAGATLAPGSRLGHYIVGNLLGQGGMGAVYQAHDTTLSRDVALKVLPDPVAADADRRRRFEREARLVAGLNHPNIVTLHAVSEDGGRLFLVMELVKGVPLSAAIPSGGLPLDRLLAIAVPIAEAIGTAHAEGITHRDLKPGNVMVAADGTVKVLDFGIAKRADAPAAAPDAATASIVTGEGHVLGTLDYMSPEQAQGLPVDARSDVFSFGVMLYEMATGQRPFKGDTDGALLAAILRDTPPPVTAINPSVPKTLARVIGRALAKDPSRRQQAGMDLRNDLDDLRRELEAGEPTAAARLPPSRAGRGAPPWLPRWAWLAGALATLAVAAAIAARQGPAPAPAAAAALTRAAIPLDNVRPASHRPIAMSADGRLIALGAGQAGLFVRDLAASNFAPIDGTQGAVDPFFSPDGQWIGFQADGHLRKVAVDGGRPIVICPLPETARGFSWADDGTIFIGMTNTTLLRVSAQGGEPQPVSRLDAALFETSHRWPFALPGTRAVLFAAGPSFTATEWNEGRIVVQSLVSGERHVLVERGSSPTVAAGHLLYQSGRTLLARRFDPGRLSLDGPTLTVASDIMRAGSGGGWFAATGGHLISVAGTAPGPSRLYWIEPGGKTTPLPIPEGAYSAPDLSPDGTRVAVTLSNPDSNIWVFDVNSGAATRLTVDGASLWPKWSHDGRRVAYSSTQGPVRIYSLPADGAGTPEPMVKTPFIARAEGWSRGGILTFIEVNPLTTDIWMWKDGKSSELIRTRYSENRGTISPDGKWLAFQSNQSGRAEIYVQPLNSNERRVQLTTTGAWLPRWSKEGHLYFARPGEVWIAESPGPGGSAVRPPRRIFANLADLDSDNQNYSVGPDGRLLMMSTASAPPPPTRIELTLNWVRIVSERMPAGQ